MYQSFYYVDDETRTFEGVSGTSHNSVLARTRRLFSGQGYRVAREKSRTGYVVLHNGQNTVVIRVEEVRN